LRHLVLALLLATAPLHAQTPPAPISVDRYDLPKQAAIGEEYTVTAHVRNNEPALALISARLYLRGEGSTLLAPAEEQTVFIEGGSVRPVSWRVKQSGRGETRFFVEASLLTAKIGGETAVSNADLALLRKEWSGVWSEPDSRYDARLTLRSSVDGAVDGRIQWTLRSAKRDDYQPKIGQSGVEFVRGSFDPKKRELVLEGYRRDDPNRILGLDRYVFTFQDAKLVGTSWNKGKQDGRFELGSDASR